MGAAGERRDPVCLCAAVSQDLDTGIPHSPVHARIHVCSERAQTGGALWTFDLDSLAIIARVVDKLCTLDCALAHLLPFIGCTEIDL